MPNSNTNKHTPITGQAKVLENTSWIYRGATLKILSRKKLQCFEQDLGEYEYKLCLKGTKWESRYPNSPFTFIYSDELEILQLQEVEQVGDDPWIRVDDQLPEMNEPLTWWNDETKQREVICENVRATVLAYDPQLGIYKAEFTKSGWSEVSSISSKGGVHPTHWMPLPCAPAAQPVQDKEGVQS